MRRALFAAGAAILLLGLALGAAEAHSHAVTRSDYEAESARLSEGDPAYDAARSDALYEALLEHRAHTAWAGRLGALGWILLALLLSQPRSIPGLELASVRRALLMSVVDAAMVGSLFVSSSVVESALGPGLAGWGALLATQLGGLAVAVAWATTSSGVGLGARLAGVRVTRADAASPGPWRGLAALALWPFTLAWTPLAFAIAVARPERPPSTAVPHLSWVGLSVRATAPRKS